MTKDDVTRLAHEAAGFDGTTSLERPVVLYAAMSKDFLDKFADLVAEMEREACAKVCEETELAFDIAVWCDSTKKEMTAHTANGLAAAIRARGEK